MASSLQSGITAAKAGQTQEALDFLKDAIIEEPQNAEVWVWIAAIIDDMDKQEIFLEKALEIDPNNIPAQRGLAYLHKRRQDDASVNGDHLSDHTSPISPFPTSRQKPQAERETGWAKIEPEDLQEVARAGKAKQTKSKTGESPENSTRLSTFEIILIAVVVIVFCFIGLLAASALFDFELPLAFLSGSRQVIKTEPPYPGVFLYVDDRFLDIQQHTGIPTSESGIPTSYAVDPKIVVWLSEADPNDMRLIYETGEYITINQKSGPGGTQILTPAQALLPGLYCFRQDQPADSAEAAAYWCFSVADAHTGE